MGRTKLSLSFSLSCVPSYSLQGEDAVLSSHKSVGPDSTIAIVGFREESTSLRINMVLAHSKLRNVLLRLPSDTSIHPTAGPSSSLSPESFPVVPQVSIPKHDLVVVGIPMYLPTSLRHSTKTSALQGTIKRDIREDAFPLLAL